MSRPEPERATLVGEKTTTELQDLIPESAPTTTEAQFEPSPEQLKPNGNIDTDFWDHGNQAPQAVNEETVGHEVANEENADHETAQKESADHDIQFPVSQHPTQSESTLVQMEKLEHEPVVPEQAQQAFEEDPQAQSDHTQHQFQQLLDQLAQEHLQASQEKLHLQEPRQEDIVAQQERTDEATSVNHADLATSHDSQIGGSTNQESASSNQEIGNTDMNEESSIQVVGNTDQETRQIEGNQDSSSQIAEEQINDIPSEPIPSEAVSSETVPSETAPSETVPSETVPSEAIPSENITSENITSENIPQDILKQTSEQNPVEPVVNSVVAFGSTEEQEEAAFWEQAAQKDLTETAVTQQEAPVTTETEKATVDAVGEAATVKVDENTKTLLQ